MKKLNETQSQSVSNLITATDLDKTGQRALASAMRKASAGEAKTGFINVIERLLIQLMTNATDELARNQEKGYINGSILPAVNREAKLRKSAFKFSIKLGCFKIATADKKIAEQGYSLLFDEGDTKRWIYAIDTSSLTATTIPAEPVASDDTTADADANDNDSHSQSDVEPVALPSETARLLAGTLAGWTASQRAQFFGTLAAELKGKDIHFSKAPTKAVERLLQAVA